MKSRLHIGLALLVLTLVTVQFSWAAKPELKCHPDGSFKVIMMSDTQDGPKLDPRAVAVMNTVLDTEKPDMVIIGGDCIAGHLVKNVQELHSAIDSVAQPMEKRKIPWAIVFGNHDQEHFAKTKMDKEQVLKIYAKYPYNLNVRGDRNIHGAGNSYLLVKSSDRKSPVFALWLIDSNEYAPKEIGGYGWIHADQVNWYLKSSENLEKKYKRKIPGIMYFHIPLREFGEMAANTKYQGDRFEDEGPSKVNSGMFSAILDRGDVKGIFCGHAHVNNYVGEWMGIKLGQDAAIGYASYNLPDSNPAHMRTRGGRAFLINEKDPWNWSTWMRFSDGNTDRETK